MARVKFTGLSELQRKLFRLPVAVQAEIKKAMEVGAQEIVELAKTLAPVGKPSGSYDGSNSPGALRDSIGWTWGDPPGGSITLGEMRGPRGSSDLFISVYAGDDKAFYARWVEFGTKAHGIDAKEGNPGGMTRGANLFGTHVDHPGAKASSFFFISYRNRKNRVKRRISRAVNVAARRVAQSG